MKNLHRRQFIKQMSLASAGLIASTSTVRAESSICSTVNSTIPFTGKHQAGITTPGQKHIYFIVLDLHTDKLEDIKQMFKVWTSYSKNLTQGKNVKEYSKNHFVPPTDTGEADSLSAHKLTLTFGVSPSFFTKLNINHLKPAELTDLPHFPRDQLKPEYIGGDVCIQACANDPQVAFNAVRNLVRVARSMITMKWSQSGFTSFDDLQTPRNLFAFKDGTANFSGQKLDEVVWVQQDNWLKNGSYLVVRRIKMFLETWDRTNATEQNNTFGRYRDSGIAFGHKDEFDTLDLKKMDEKGNPMLPDSAHVKLAHQTGLNILRRSYSYASGIDDHAQFDAGLLFISFQNDPKTFITIQNSLGNTDKMNEYITHIGSGLFACFPGVSDEQDYLGRSLFDAI